jgi:hypothetical protein
MPQLWQKWIAARGNTVAASTSAWKAYGRGPLIGDDARFSRIAFNGHADLGGRINHFAYDSKSGRLFASAGQGGVWALDKGSTTWRSIGDTLPTQAVGGIGFAAVGTNGTLIVLTGNDAFGGGTTSSGGRLPLDRPAKRGQRRGIPTGQLVPGRGRSDQPEHRLRGHRGRALPVDRCAGVNVKPWCRRQARRRTAPARPDRRGLLPREHGHRRRRPYPGGVGANKKGGAVIAVGCAGNKTTRARSIPRTSSRPGTAHTSPTGAPGTFTKVDQANFTGDSNPIGRIELGAAVGPQQDHGYLYAIVQDATAFQGGSEVGGIDAPGLVGGQPSVKTTYLKGIYVSADFGQTWTLAAGPAQLMQPGNGSSLTVCLPVTTRASSTAPASSSGTTRDRARSHAGRRQRRSTRLTFGPRRAGRTALPTRTSRSTADEPPGDRLLHRRDVLPEPYSASPPARPLAGTAARPSTDHHDGFYVPDGQGGVTLYDGSDGGVGFQHVAAGEALPTTTGVAV